MPGDIIRSWQNTFPPPPIIFEILSVIILELHIYQVSKWPRILLLLQYIPSRSLTIERGYGMSPSEYLNRAAGMEGSCVSPGWEVCHFKSHGYLHPNPVSWVEGRPRTDCFILLCLTRSLASLHNLVPPDHTLPCAICVNRPTSMETVLVSCAFPHIRRNIEWIL